MPLLPLCCLLPVCPAHHPLARPGEGSSSPQGRGSCFSSPPAAFRVRLRWGGPTPLEGTPVLVEGWPAGPALRLPVRGQRAFSSPCLSQTNLACPPLLSPRPRLVETLSLTSSGFPCVYRLRPRAACPQTLDVRTRLPGGAGNAQVPPWVTSLSELSGDTRIHSWLTPSHP